MWPLYLHFGDYGSITYLFCLLKYSHIFPSQLYQNILYSVHLQKGKRTASIIGNNTLSRSNAATKVTFEGPVRYSEYKSYFN